MLKFGRKKKPWGSVGIRGDGDRGKYSPVTGIRDRDGERIHRRGGAGIGEVSPAPDPPH